MEQLTKILIKLIVWSKVSVWFAKKMYKHLICILNDTSESIYELFLNFRIQKALNIGCKEHEDRSQRYIQETNYRTILSPSIPPEIKYSFDKYKLNIDGLHYNGITASLILKASCKNCSIQSGVSIPAERDLYDGNFMEDYAYAISKQCGCYNSGHLKLIN